jgi:hypothetical protein
MANAIPPQPTPSPIDSEALIGIEQARRLPFLPKTFAFSTVWGWATTGLDDVVLESRRVGGMLCTSEGAMRRFFAARSAKPPQAEDDAVARANAYLDAKGVK